jgi:broad specificity phosphatase PhoE
MLEIYIARHGTTESNKRKIYAGRGDERLAPIGMIQAETLGRSLRPLGIKKIYSSPLQRALETSQIVGNILRIPVEIEEGLTEMKLGAWTGLSEDEVDRTYPEDYKLWNSMPANLILPARETLAEVLQRVLNAISHIEKVSDGFPVLAVSHVAVIRCLFLHYQRMDMNLYKTIDVPNISVLLLQIDQGLANISRYL